jgi:hypothetical protein
VESVKQIDAAISELCTVLYQSVPFDNWGTAKLVSKYVPAGDVSKHEYNFLLQDGSEGLYARLTDAALCDVEALTKRHWQLTQDLGQPRWYKMIVTVERSGKFNVEFEYKDDYQEGEIMKRG